MSQFTLRRVQPMSVAKVLGIMYTVLGLVIGAFISLVSLAGPSQAGAANPFPPWLVGIGAIIAVPIFYGTLGFISGLIGAALYNFFSGIVGGIVVEVDSSATGV